MVPCRGSNTYQQYIFSEYLIYKLYNIITDNSFRVRLIRVNYSDTSGKFKPGHTYTFIIESHKSLAGRQQCIPIKNDNLNMHLIEPRSAAMMYVFQFMVGNTDWSVHGLHNLKLLKTLDPTIPKPIAIPYDFDYAGLVNTNYSVPGEHVDIKEVTERAYMGVCQPEALMEQTFEHFLAKEQAIMSAIENLPYMEKSRVKMTKDYIEKFYDIIREPKRRNFHIINQCKQ